MNCLVLGGAGFLGSHLCDGLLRGGHAVRVFDRANVDKSNIDHILNSIEMVEGDFSDGSQHAALLDDVDVIYHLISTTVPQTSNENPVFDVASNVMASLRFFNAAIDAGVKKIVFFSSGGTVYGINQAIPIGEDHATDPICSYGIGKLAIEKYLKLYQHLYGLDYTILRISNPYGDRQRATDRQGVVAAFVARALEKWPLEIWGDGSAIRDYIYVTDVAAAAVAVLKYTGKFRLFNIGSGNGLSLIDVARVIEEVLGRPLKLNFSPAGKLHVPANVLDITRVRRELGWAPMIGFRDGVRRMIGEKSNYKAVRLLGGPDYWPERNEHKEIQYIYK